MTIWKKPFTLDDLNRLSKNTLMEQLDICVTGFGEDFLEATMPVDHRTKQIAGLLHGGASVALAESVGSLASYLCVEGQENVCVGVEINANHLLAVRSGHVTARAKPLRIGKRLHVWDIQIHNSAHELICICRLTTTVVQTKN